MAKADVKLNLKIETGKFFGTVDRVRFEIAAEKLACNRFMPLWVAKVVLAIWVALRIVASWPRTIVLRVRRAIAPWWHLLLDDSKTYQRWRQKRVEKRVARCDRKGHAIRGTVLPDGQPGKMCELCDYAVAITPKEFKQLFHISFHTAIARAKRRGHEVANADKVAR